MDMRQVPRLDQPRCGPSSRRRMSPRETREIDPSRGVRKRREMDTTDDVGSGSVVRSVDPDVVSWSVERLRGIRAAGQQHDGAEGTDDTSPCLRHPIAPDSCRPPAARLDSAMPGLLEPSLGCSGVVCHDEPPVWRCRVCHWSSAGSGLSSSSTATSSSTPENGTGIASLARQNPAVEMALVRVEVEQDTHRKSPLRSASGADRDLDDEARRRSCP